MSRLPGGPGTVVGDLGLDLDAGRALRVGVARALLADPAILVLDSVIDRLDPVRGAALLARLRTDRPGLTVVATGLEAARFPGVDSILRLGRAPGRGGTA